LGLVISSTELRAIVFGRLTQKLEDALKLNLISWNIRHLRMEKVNAYIAHIIEQIDAGHVMFFYENKASNSMSRDFIDTITKPLTSSAGAGSMRLTWGGHKYQVYTNEFVWIVWSKTCTTGPKSQFTKANAGKGQPFTIEVSPQHAYDKDLLEFGKKALRSSTNLTVMSNLASGKGDFRIPAVVHITITKPNGATKTINVASWHAPGPAQGSAPLLNYYFQTFLKGKVDIFLGDFNMTGLEATPSNITLPLVLHRTNTSTTYTATGPVNHAEGLDLVYADATRIAAGTAVSGSQIGSAVVSVIPKPTTMTYAEAFELTDHLPVLVTLKSL
jgi:hypothetical protein